MSVLPVQTKPTSDGLQRRLLESVAENALDGILVVDSNGAMSYFNHHFVEMWNLPESVLASRRDEDATTAVLSQVVEPESFRARIAHLYRHPMEKSRDEIRLRDGRIIDRYSSPVIDEDGVALGRAWFFRDVSEARRTQAATELLANAGELFGSSLDSAAILGQLAHLIVPRFADWAAVDVLDEAGVFRRSGVAHVDPEGVELLLELNRRYPLRANEGRLRGKVVATGKPVALYDIGERDLAQNARDPEHQRLLEKVGVRSALWVPLIAHKRVLGVISAGYRDGRNRYTPADLDLFVELARRAALAVDNALLHRTVGRSEQRQAALSAIGERALAGAPIADLLREAAEIISTTVDVPYAEVLELSADGRRLNLVSGVGWKPGTVGRASVDAGLGSQGGYALTRVGPVVVSDLPSEKRFRPPSLLTDHGVTSGLTVVIGGSTRPYGVLGAHSDRPRLFAEDDVNFVQSVANVLAAAIERQRAEDQLGLVADSERSRAAELKAVIQSIGDAVVVCAADGSVALANPAAEDLLGDRLEHGLAGILPIFDWPPGVSPRLPAPTEVAELRVIPDTQEQARVPDSEARWLELSTYPVIVGDTSAGDGGGIILVLRDVSAARNARAVREAFIGILSHELRTPVTTIYGGSEMLARTGAGITEDQRREIHEDIRAEADRLYRLVENLLVLSRVERQGLQIESEPVLLQRLLPRVAEGEAARWPKVNFELDLPAGLPPVAAEETYLEQVLRNLLANAAKYGGEGRVDVKAEAPDGVVRVTVSDSGSGFEEAEGPRLFEIFYRSPSASRRASGAGIGLFVSQQLVRAMDGHMWAVNRPKGGAEFGLELPVFGE
jgi:signal transduction histidine kinase